MGQGRVLRWVEGPQKLRTYILEGLGPKVACRPPNESEKIMRCSCCFKKLSEFESTRRNAETLEFLDMCSKCLSEVKKLTPIKTKDRHDLINNILPDEDFED